jgi:hypothetical protein
LDTGSYCHVVAGSTKPVGSCVMLDKVALALAGGYDGRMVE